MNDLVIFDTKNWIVSYRSDSRYPGYLMISSVEEVDKLSRLSSNALCELGNVLTSTEKLLVLAYEPYKVITTKLGFSKGFNCHFHMIPIVKSVLHEIKKHPKYTNEDPDGIDAILFICREYCEKDLTNQESLNIKQEVNKLKQL